MIQEITADKKDPKRKDQKRIVLLDMHAILHRGFHALPDFASSKGEPTGALYGLVSILTKIISDLHPDYIVGTYDLPKPTHRHIAYEHYKSHRPKTDDALVAQIIRSREVLDAFAIPHYELEGFEADDLLGTIVEELKHKRDVDVIIASGDMDTMQLVDDKKVRVFTPKKGLSETVLYDEDGVKARFGFGPTLIPDYKGLRGDPSDNIPGVKGIGEKTATTLITTFGTLEQIYETLEKHPDWLEHAGIKAGMIEKLRGQKEEAEMSKALAEIRRDAPMNFVLPAHKWRESISEKAILDMLAVFEFRSLIPRIKSLLEGSKPEQESLEEKSGRPGDGDPRTFLEDFPAEAGKESSTSVSDEEFKKIALATSVLDSNIPDPTLDDIYRLGNSDTFEGAAKAILADIKEKQLDFVYEKIELPLMSVLRGMEKRGVKIDKAFLANLSKTYHIELKKLETSIFEAAGGEFNINSPKQLGEVLFDKLGLIAKKKTATGARSTKESELEKLKSEHPVVGYILSYRELQKLLSTYIDNLPTLVDSEDRVHTTFIQMGAATGRLATKNPGLQNIPIKTELGRAIRRGFITDRGYSLVSFDYSQIELRIAAWLSGDPGLVDIFSRGGDAHAEVASRVFHVRPEEVSYDQRRVAKVINFGILYGMGVNSLRESLGTTRAEAQEFYNQYFEAFPKLAAYIDDVKASASLLGYTQTFFGRRRYFDGIKSPIPYVKASAERMAINAPIQGTQADIIKLAMVEIDQLFEKEGHHAYAYLLLQVHDELVFEIKEEKVAELAPKIKKIMEGIVDTTKTKGIPLLAEGKVGENWGEMKKV